MVSWQVPYLAKGCRLDFNNGLRGDSNSGPILAPSVHLSLTQITASPMAISILCQMELHLFLSATFGFLTGVVSDRGLQPDFINGLRGDSNSGPILTPGVYWSLTGIMAPGHLHLELHLFMSPTYGFLAGAISNQGLKI